MATKRPQGYIYLGKDEDGREIRRYVSANTPAQLERAKTALRRQYDKGLLALHDMPFAKLAETWYKGKRGVPGTLVSYRRSRDVLVAALGYRKASQIRPMHIRAILDPLGPAAASHVLLTAKQIFKLGAENGVIAVNPCNYIRVGYKPSKRSVLTPPDLTALARADLWPEDRLFVNLMLYAGLRRGEAAALQFSDIADGRVSVHHIIDFVTGRREERTKTPAGVREVVICDQLAACLPVCDNSMEMIFTRRGGRMMTASATSRRWERITQQWNLAAGGTKDLRAIGKYTCHNLRHTGATMWALNGATPDQLQYMLGHEDAMISMNVYSHANKLHHMIDAYRPFFHRYAGLTEVQMVFANSIENNENPIELEPQASQNSKIIKISP